MIIIPESSLTVRFSLPQPATKIFKTPKHSNDHQIVKHARHHSMDAYTICTNTHKTSVLTSDAMQCKLVRGRKRSPSGWKMSHRMAKYNLFKHAGFVMVRYSRCVPVTSWHMCINKHKQAIMYLIQTFHTEVLSTP